MSITIYAQDDIMEDILYCGVGQWDEGFAGEGKYSSVLVRETELEIENIHERPFLEHGH